MKIAQDSLGKMSWKYKQYYDQKSGSRKLMVGDKALLLLPTKTNKLLMGWKGPHEVLEVTPLDYKIKLRNKERTFHINMLKRYVEGKDSDQSSNSDVKLQPCAVAVLDMASEESEESDIANELVETPSLSEQTDWQQVNINPDLSDQQRKQAREVVG